jgi:outer membrane lipoprotein-sorting protein
MNILRRLPLSRLLLACAAVLALGAGITALATALGTGPTPPPAPLASAVHDALAATPVGGVSARIQFTDHLVEGANLASESGNNGPSKSSPLLSGASGRLWISAAGKVRLELQSESGDTQILYDGQTLSMYDASSNTLYRIQLPQDSNTDGNPEGTQGPGQADTHQIPTVEEIQNTITHLMGHVDLSGATPSDVAGQPAYSVHISPKRDGGLVGGAELAWDAVHGVPLRLALYSTSSSAPVLELTATEVSYGPVADSVFEFSPPADATIHELKGPNESGDGADAANATQHHTHTKAAQGPAAVQASIPFTLDAPATLDGMALSQVRSIDFDGHPAALITYGQGLGGIAVVESQAKSGDSQSAGPAAGLGSLPTVSINGSTAQELPTALGTLLTFQRAGVDYTIVGSVTPAAAEAAARGL